jgi:hypothetical protein
VDEAAVVVADVVVALGVSGLALSLPACACGGVEVAVGVVVIGGEEVAA